MKNDFHPDNTHQHNVKVAIDKIIGQTTEIKRKKKSDADHKRIVFKRIIEGIVEVEERTTVIEEMFLIDLGKYNKFFFNIIDDFLNLNFNKEQIRLIDFYLYDRYTPDGNVLQLIDGDNNQIKLDTPDELWFLLKGMDGENKQTNGNSKKDI